MNTVKCLIQVPANDGNFLAALKNATKEELQEAIHTMEANGGSHKSRILACERELKKRSDLYSFFKNAEFEQIEDFKDKLGETIFDFFNEESNVPIEIGIGVKNVLLSCKSKAEFKIADDMLSAICGYGIESVLEKIKQRDKEDYTWESIW